MKYLPAFVLFTLIALGLCGCTQTTVTSGNLTLRRLSFMQRVEVPSLMMATNGTLTLSGYATDGGAEVIAAVTEAAVKGAVKGMKPGP